MIGEDRFIVTDVAGTTRDSLYTRYNQFGFEFDLIDTAGIRKKTKISENVEFYSILRSIRAIENSDVSILIYDSKRGFDSQDQNIFWLASKNKKGIIILSNKWDLVEKDQNTTSFIKDKIHEKTSPFIDAYTDLVVSKKKVEINVSNLNLLERQVENDKNRLERSEINLTDFAQSEASLAGANARLIEAQNKLITSKLNYEKTIGIINNYEDLSGTYVFNYELPASLASANQIAKKENPDLNIAILELEQSQQDILIARSELSPSASLSYKMTQTEDISSSYDETDKEILKAEATWPIFSGGKNIASLKKSKSLKQQKQLLLEDSKKSNKASVANAWSNFQSSKSFLISIRSQVTAAEIAYEGITTEYESGSDRSTLDVIQSNSILLEAKINLVNSKRDFLLSQFRLLSSIGRLTGSYLGIN